jgi:hypothetical protein
LVLSVDEKSQIQALDRTQPSLPLKIGRGATMTSDYKRNGTTTLFAALNIANGDTQTCKSETLAGVTQAVPRSLHANIVLMAQYGGTILPRPDSESH